MLYYLTKVIVTALLIVIISEVAKRSSFAGGILASIPLVSVLAMIWLYVDTKDIEKISHLSTSIFYLVIPSLGLFITLPILLGRGVGFYPSIVASIIITVVCYYIMIVVFGKLGAIL